MSGRRYDIDSLRIFAILTVFLFHCSRFFDTEGWHLKDARQSEILFVSVRVLVWPWLMELFFLLSGFGAYHSLRSRTARAFLWERLPDILTPDERVRYLGEEPRAAEAQGSKDG